MLLTVALVLLATGCSGGSPQTRPTPADPPAGSATIDDPAGDTLGNAAQDGTDADLRRVSVSLDGDRLTIVYELAAPVPAANTVLLSTTVFGEDGNEEHDLRLKFVEDEPPLVFVFDDRDGQHNLDGVRPTIEGSTITVTYPASTVAGLGEFFTWSATSNVDGQDVDHAPDAGSLTFPA